MIISHYVSRTGIVLIQLKWFLVFVAGFLAFIMLVVTFTAYLIWRFFRSMSRLGKTANGFLEAVRRQDLGKACSYFATGFPCSDKKKTQEFLRRSPFAEYQKATWPRRDIENNRGEVEGSITLKSGAKMPVRIGFVKEDGTWKICSLEGSRDEVEAHFAAGHFSPNSAMEHFTRGTALVAQNDLDGAMAEFRTAIRLSPGDAQFHGWLGMTLQAKGDLDGAIHEYQIALGLDPDLAIVRLNFGTVLMARDDLEGALNEFRAAVRLAPDNPAAHSQLGAALQMKGDWEAATAEFRSALRLNPNDASVQLNLGLRLHHVGDLAGAVAKYRIALEVDPNLAAAHYNLGVPFAIWGTRKPRWGNFKLHCGSVRIILTPMETWALSF